MAQTKDLQPQDIVHDDGNERSVVLSSLFNEYASAMLVARFDRRYVRLDRLTTEQEDDDTEKTPRTYQMSADAMRALCAAWQQYEADIKAEEEAEEAARLAEITALRAAIEQLGGTMTGPLGDYRSYGDYFDVEFTGRWAHCSMSDASLSRVKHWLADTARTLAGEKQNDAEAQAERALEERAADF